MHSAIGDLIDITPGVELQNKNLFRCLLYLIDEPIFTNSCPESVFVAFTLFDIKIG